MQKCAFLGRSWEGIAQKKNYIWEHGALKSRDWENVCKYAFAKEKMPMKCVY